MATSSKRITKRIVDALPAETTIWDTDIAGFGVRRQRRDKTYSLKCRVNGRQKWITIGKHGAPWTVEMARHEAVRLLGILAGGGDPSETRDRVKRDLTISELCDLYTAENSTLKKDSTLATDKGRIERHIKPLIGKFRCQEVSRANVERMRNDIAAGKTAIDVKTGFRGRAIVRGGQGTANKAVSLLGAIFTFAVERDLREGNPVHGVKQYQGKKLERYLSTKEMARLGEALEQAEANGANIYSIAAVRALLLTGARKGEILNLRWSEIDFDQSCLRLPDSKTGAKIIPVGPAVLSFLSTLPRIEGNAYVFPGRTAGRPMVNLTKIWHSIRSEAGLSDVRIHDFRHSFASIGAAGGESLMVIGKVLSHANSATTERYAHLSDDPVKAAARRISDKVNLALSSGGGSEIVPA
jgi:integrase